jgi:HAMP domain-containing protein
VPGEAGPQGPSGPQGQEGQQGPQGAPGEVSTAQLTNAIATTSSNTNAVELPNLIVSDPPTQAEVQALANKVQELIQALRR